MRVYFFVISFIFIHADNEINFDAYCNLKCYPPNIKHTVCEYKCELGPDCAEFKDIPLSEDDRKFMRDTHNYYRNRIASGADTKGGNGAAKDMLVMNYHRTTEVSTLCWGRRCVFGHDRCRQTLALGDYAGQNLFMQASTNPIDADTRDLLNLTASKWYGEIKDTTKNVINSFPKGYPKMIGHFTQMVWALTQYVGCSRITFTKNGQFRHHLHIICNYSPSGNYIGAPVYKFGKGCTAPQKPNTKFRALCGTIHATMIGKSVTLGKGVKCNALNIIIVYFVSIVYLVV